MHLLRKSALVRICPDSHQIFKILTNRTDEILILIIIIRICIIAK
jgi:hypothetical protein